VEVFYLVRRKHFERQHSSGVSVIGCTGGNIVSPVLVLPRRHTATSPPNDHHGVCSVFYFEGHRAKPLRGPGLTQKGGLLGPPRCPPPRIPRCPRRPGLYRLFTGDRVPHAAHLTSSRRSSNGSLAHQKKRRYD
jgi:hypothetical protein